MGQLFEHSGHYFRDDDNDNDLLLRIYNKW